jgi:hypothetical protein
VSGKGTGRVSAAGLVCYKSGARSRLFYRVRTHRDSKGERRPVSKAGCASLVTAAHHQLHAPMIFVWVSNHNRRRPHPAAPDFLDHEHPWHSPFHSLTRSRRRSRPSSLLTVSPRTSWDRGTTSSLRTTREPAAPHRGTRRTVRGK